MACRVRDRPLGRQQPDSALADCPAQPEQCAIHPRPFSGRHIKVVGAEPRLGDSELSLSQSPIRAMPKRPIIHSASISGVLAHSRTEVEVNLAVRPLFYATVEYASLHCGLWLKTAFAIPNLRETSAICIMHVIPNKHITCFAAALRHVSSMLHMQNNS